MPPRPHIVLGRPEASGKVLVVGSAESAKAGWPLWTAILVSALVIIGIGFYIVEPLLLPAPLPPELQQPPAATLEDAQIALRQHDYSQAVTLARQLLADDPTNSDALLLAGEAAVKMGEVEAALQYYRAVRPGDSDDYVTSLWSAGAIYLRQGKLREAETSFRQAVELDPDNLIANQELGFLLGVEGRRWESIPYLLEPIRQGRILMEPLLLLGTVDHKFVDAKQLVDLSRQAEPDNWVPMIGVASVMLYHRQYDEAEQLLHEIVQHEPQQMEAYALLGRAIVENPEHDADQLIAWHESLPEVALQHPVVWYVQGLWGEERGDVKGAARCFWEATRLNPNHQRASYRLGQILTTLGRDSDAQQYLQRASLLQTLIKPLALLFNQQNQSQPDIAQMTEAARLCYELGRYWESWAWYHLILAVDPGNEAVKKETQKLQALTSENPPLVAKDMVPANKVDLSSFPLPRWNSAAGSKALADSKASAAPKFVDLAHEAGFDFTSNNGDDPDEPGMLLCQEFGGAMAVIDFDLDGWPDIYAAQSGPWPPDPQQTQFRDRLFRNLGNGKFADVTEAAHLGDNLYSQGAAVGDYDADGWPDIFLANIGMNRLYHNEGDGTFREVTAQSRIAGALWSTSAAMADLTGDGLADLYVVNYLAGKDALERICYEEGQPRACPPHEFPGEQDRFYVNQGDESFVDATESAGMVAPDGKGIGLVVGDFHGQGQLSVYVANDMTANFYFVNQAAKRGDTPQFQEIATPGRSGLRSRRHRAGIDGDRRR